MLGPSGSGKTTTLRMIAGFELPTPGRSSWTAATSSRLAPYERDVNTVFQDYALFPHMDVARQRRLRADGAQGGASRSAASGWPRRCAMVRLEGYEKRKPEPAVRRPAAARRAGPGAGQPAQGAAARRAAGRARPEAARGDADRAQDDPAQVGITFIFVTHDQDEALTMSDRIAVFNQGKIEQVGSPAEVYERRGRRSSPASWARRTC